MNKLDDDIRNALIHDDPDYDLDREESIFRQIGDMYRGKWRWMAVLATIESVVAVVLIILATMKFLDTDETKWQIFYATGVVLLSLLILLVKIWGWMQMHHYRLLREIKRMELRILESKRTEA